VLHDRLEESRVELDAQLVGHGDQERVRVGDGRIIRELFDELVGLADVAAPEGRLQPVDDADLVARLGLGAEPEVVVVLLRDEGDDAATDRNSW